MASSTTRAGMGVPRTSMASSSPTSTSGGTKASAMPWPSSGEKLPLRDLSDRLAVAKYRLLGTGRPATFGRQPVKQSRDPALLLGFERRATAEVAFGPADHPTQARLQRRDAGAQLMAVQRQPGLEAQGVARRPAPPV